MSYILDGQTTAVLKALGTAPIGTNTSFSVVVWAKFADATPSSAVTIISLGQNGGSTPGVGAKLSALGIMSYSAQRGGTITATVGGTVKPANGTWFAVAGMYTINGSNQATAVDGWIVDAVNGNTDTPTQATGTQSMNTLDSFILGGALNGTDSFTSIATCSVCHAALYSGLLDSTDLTNLKTKTPDNFTPTSATLLHYWPLLTDLNDTVGTLHLTAGTGATPNNGDGPTLDAAAPTVAYLSMDVAGGDSKIYMTYAPT